MRELVSSSLLPTEGLVDQFPAGFVVARDGRVVVGSAGLERYENVGLLRSVVVARERRGVGLGGALVRNRLQFARSLDVNVVYLLTTNAMSYFERIGFIPRSRADVPAALAQSVEFAHACPASAACLVYSL